MFKIKIEYLPSYDKEWEKLSYKHPGDSGFDLRAAISEPVTLEPNERANLLAVSDKQGVRIVDSNNLKVTARLGAKQNLFKSFKSDPQVGIYFSTSC